MKIKSLLSSRRFWVAVAGVVAVVSDGLGWGLTEEQTLALALMVATWIGADTYRKTE